MSELYIAYSSNYVLAVHIFETYGVVGDVKNIIGNLFVKMYVPAWASYDEAYNMFVNQGIRSAFEVHYWRPIYLPANDSTRIGFTEFAEFAEFVEVNGFAEVTEFDRFTEFSEYYDEDDLYKFVVTYVSNSSPFAAYGLCRYLQFLSGSHGVIQQIYDNTAAVMKKISHPSVLAKFSKALRLIADYA